MTKGKIGSGRSQENPTRTYKGFNYQRVWSRKHGSTSGQMVYCIVGMPDVIWKDNELYEDRIVRILFNNFWYTKDMKEAIDNFIASYPKIHEQVLRG
jgi:hypothetical protein|tara:strand:- start:617 stop:907 length:291 start_codon:yes stop_codon:yes gene_type:complete